MTRAPTALVADDEPLLRDAFTNQLQRAWPELHIVGHARNGLEAIELFNSLSPDICFLDVQMPGLSGVKVAQHIARRAHIVFVTAFDHYAVQAFSEGALDYIVKPVKAARLADTVARLQQRLVAAQPAVNSEKMLQDLAEALARSRAAATNLRWIKATVGQVVRLISVDDIDFLQSDAKYTNVAWRDESGEPAEAIVRMPLRELAAQLDPEQFAQVHRSFVVNFKSISRVVRAEETATIHLKGRRELVPVSRTFIHVFRQT